MTSTVEFSINTPGRFLAAGTLILAAFGYVGQQDYASERMHECASTAPRGQLGVWDEVTDTCYYETLETNQEKVHAKTAPGSSPR